MDRIAPVLNEQELAHRARHRADMLDMLRDQSAVFVACTVGRHTRNSVAVEWLASPPDPADAELSKRRFDSLTDKWRHGLLAEAQDVHGFVCIWSKG